MTKEDLAVLLKNENYLDLDYYEMLGISPDASREEVATAALEVHNKAWDLQHTLRHDEVIDQKQREAELDRFLKHFKMASATLLDSEKRAEYDKDLHQRVNQLIANQVVATETILPARAPTPSSSPEAVPTQQMTPTQAPQPRPQPQGGKLFMATATAQEIKNDLIQWYRNMQGLNPSLSNQQVLKGMMANGYKVTQTLQGNVPRLNITFPSQKEMQFFNQRLVSTARVSHEITPQQLQTLSTQSTKGVAKESVPMAKPQPSVAKEAESLAKTAVKDVAKGLSPVPTIPKMKPR